MKRLLCKQSATIVKLASKRFKKSSQQKATIVLINAWLVTNNYYTRPARKLADSNDVLLIDRDLLIKLSTQVNRQNEQQPTNLKRSSY
ncbi:restriction endonuclease [Bacillus toyonensis]|uniref:restriction endonuclease n=1 Tax=Bacillus toyonensis TaxID=155322 RepID=UPI00352A2538